MPNVKPLSPVINWNHPLTRGLKFDMPAWENNLKPRDIVNNIIGAPTGSATTIGIGPIGSALSFNGTVSNYVDFAEATPYIITGSAITMEGWVIINDTAGGQIFCKPHATSGHTSPFFSWTIQTTTAGGRIWISTSGNSGGVSTSESVMTVGVLYHVVGTYDGSNIKFYLNAVLKASTGASGTLTNFSGTPIRITSNGGGSEVLNGKIFNARMWNVAFSQSQIASLYANPWQFYYKNTRPKLNTVSAPVAATGSNLLTMGI